MNRRRCALDRFTRNDRDRYSSSSRDPRARQLSAARMQIHCGNATRLPFINANFDLVVQFVVFSSILDRTVKEMVAREMLRVLKEKGLILWYDFFVNNPSNPDVRGIRKREITHLFPDCHIDFHRVSSAPPLCRLLAPYTWGGVMLLNESVYLIPIILR